MPSSTTAPRGRSPAGRASRRLGSSSIRPASAAALPSTSRAAMRRHRAVASSMKAGNPIRNWSPIHCSSASSASRIARSVSSARFPAAASRRAVALASSSGSSGASGSCCAAARTSFGPAGLATEVAPVPGVLGVAVPGRRRPSHSVTQSGVSAWREAPAPHRHRARAGRARACTGTCATGKCICCRGRASRPSPDTGSAPEPAHSPQSSAPSRLMPMPDHFAGLASPAAALSDA